MSATVGCLLAILVFVTSGCSSLHLPTTLAWLSPANDEPSPPTRMVAVWTDAIMHQPGQAGVRGVGGRLLFYPDHSEKTLQVDGTLTVYAYDDMDQESAHTAPVRKFVFLPEQLEKRHSTSQLGSTYNVWLPWDEVGHAARQLTLIARFETSQGAVVMSDPARQLLPGTAVTPVVKEARLEPQIRQLPTAHRDSHVVATGYESAASPAPKAAGTGRDSTGAGSGGLETFTIDVPPDVARRWSAAVTQTPTGAARPGTTLPRNRPLPTVAAVAADDALAEGTGDASPDAAGSNPVSQEFAGRRVESATPHFARNRRNPPRRVPNPYLDQNQD
jgi:hypothetical protein